MLNGQKCRDNISTSIKLLSHRLICLCLLFSHLSCSFVLLRTLRQWVIVVLLCVGFVLIKLANTSLYHINTGAQGHADRFVWVNLRGHESTNGISRKYIHIRWFRGAIYASSRIAPAACPLWRTSQCGGWGLRVCVLQKINNWFLLTLTI